jgi:hypothetical protein
MNKDTKSTDEVVKCRNGHQIMTGTWCYLCEREADATARAAFSPEGRSTRRETCKIIIDGIDVTEHVAAMYDAIVTSMDWGSDFLDTETIVSIMLVGKLAGFEVPHPAGDKNREARYWRQRAAWAAQVDAMVQAKIEDAKECK